MFYCADCDVWVDEPTKKGLIVYSVIIPILSMLGIICNILSLIVLLRKDFFASIYTYLSVLALNDLVSSCLLLIAGLCRGVLWWMPRLPEYEAIFSISVGGIFNCWSVITVIAVTLDRVVYLWNPTRTTRPKFCRQKVARTVMLFGLVFSIIFNLPYCFMYTWTPEESITVRPFVKSTFFTVHIWMKLVLFGIVPGAFLIFGNAFLIRSLRRLKLESRLRLQKYNRNIEFKRKSNRDQMWTTITLVLMVFFFLIVVIPSQLVSRPSAVPILFFGDAERADKSRALEVLRQIATLLSAINITVNFIIYYMFCPSFRANFNRMFGSRKNKRKSSVQINVFYIGEREDNTYSRWQLVNFNIIKIFYEYKVEYVNGAVIY